MLKKIPLKKLILSILTIGCASANCALSDELDYLWDEEEKASDTNILFILDSSASMHENYSDIVSTVNPSSNPTNTQASRLMTAITEVVSRCMHSSFIQPSVEMTNDTWYCPEGQTTRIAEGYFTECEVPYEQRWFVRKMDIVRDIIRDALPGMLGSQVGFMQTGLNSQGFDAWFNAGSPDGVNPRTSYPDTSNTNNGSYVINAFTPLTDNDDAIAVADVIGQKYRMKLEVPYQTPITESLYEAYTYYKGERSKWMKATGLGWPEEHINDIDLTAYDKSILNSSYKTAITECSDNHVVIVTDGQPSYDWHANPEITAMTKAFPSPPTTGNTLALSTDSLPEHTLLEELSGFMASQDISSDLPGVQSVMTHAISTWPDSDSTEILDQMVAASGGFHINLEDVSELGKGLEELVTHIKSMKKPITGYNVLYTQTDGKPFTNTDRAYVSIWEYRGMRWTGNLKLFQLNDNGDIVGKFGQPFLLDTGEINPEVTSLWSETPDISVISGGAGALMSPPNSNRYIIPEKQLQNNTRIRQNRFLMSNSNANFRLMDYEIEEQFEPNTFINWLAGADTQDLDHDGNTTEVRQSLGDSLNHKPAIAYYTGSDHDSAVIYSGTNDGLLHAIESETGTHLFSYMPHQLMNEAVKQSQSFPEKAYGIDGEINIWHDDQNGDANLLTPAGEIDRNESLMLFFGLGRGGNGVYALDITSKDDPVLAWAIDDKTQGFESLSQVWSKPKPIRVQTSETSYDNLLLIAGGMDPALHNTQNLENSTGNALYIVDTYTGQKRWSISNGNSDIVINGMNHSIISAPAVVDTNSDGFVDIFYFNDIRGQVFKCSFIEERGEITLDCKMIAQAQTGNELLFTAGIDVSITRIGGRKVNALSLSSGNRFAPKETQHTNRLVVFFDDTNSNDENSPVITVNNIHNVTQALAPESQYNIQGWYYDFTHPGEKSLNQSLMFDNKIIISTYVPSNQRRTDCSEYNKGQNFIYGFSLTDGSAITSQSSFQIWEGLTHGLPATPDALIKRSEGNLYGLLNMGAYSTHVDLKIDPMTRTYWMQSK